MDQRAGMTNRLYHGRLGIVKQACPVTIHGQDDLEPDLTFARVVKESMTWQGEPLSRK